MNFTIGVGDALSARVDVLVLPVFEGGLEEKRFAEPAPAADRKLKGLLRSAAKDEGFTGKADQTLVFHTHAKVGATRILVVGLGAKGRSVTEPLRMAVGRAVRTSRKLKAKTAAVALPKLNEVDGSLRAAVEGALLGAYRFDKYLTNQKSKTGAPLGKVVLFVHGGGKPEKSAERAVVLGRRVAEATNSSRDLVNEPASVVTPTKLADEAIAIGEKHGLEVTVAGRDEITDLKMGLFLGVARGSVEEPKLIHLSYVPKDAEAAKNAPLALVGKAITFDSGGLSLKTTDGMLDMKTDMAGAAAVLGAMQVIAHLQPPFPVHGFMGACENMPSGNAYRLGDVLTSRLGKTVEVTNTDAEGRLVLGDVLAWANELRPFAIIDLATLTGACMVALGHYITGAFGNDDALMDELLQAAREAGEEIWRLPLSDLQRETMRSDVADMKNLGDRMGGAISAAMFLKEFVGKTPWVHLDIAGPSQSPKDRGYFIKGATGSGVRTLVELVRRRAEALLKSSMN